MTTNGNNMTDPQDLIDSLRITKTQRRTTAGGAWVKGTIGGHRFDALVFPEHAESPSYELGNSRISKLWLQRIDDRITVLNFDRGWDIHPATKTAEAIVDLLDVGLAELIYAE